MKKLILGTIIIGICLIGTDAFAIIGIDSYVVLMLHFNGEQDSEEFIDSSYNNHTITPNWLAGCQKITTTESKFGGASGYFNGSYGMISALPHEDWSFGDGDFTIDFWINWENWKHNKLVIGGMPNRSGMGHIFSHTGMNARWEAVIGAGEEDVEFGSEEPNNGQWYHLAVVRSGDTIYAFRDGIMMDTETVSGAIPDFYDDKLRIGGSGNTFYDSNCYLDELRISKGIARWTSNFTPPTSEYTEGVIPEPSTMLLLGFSLLGAGLFKRKR